MIQFMIELLTHTDQYLQTLIASCGNWTYLILFLIVFCETGLVVTPFLPGDSLLFAAGAISSVTGALDPVVLFILFFVAAVAGDSLNYEIGRTFRKRFNFPFVNEKRIQETERFFDRHGGKTIVIARFMPVIRTFAPFVAGAAKLRYRYFLTYNLVGAFLWVCIVFGLGYFCGNMPWVQQNFNWLIWAIILVSILPAVIAFLRKKS